mmetsp:Transcript_92727/g.276553  ORF Transcript_92727/g.276553 Transcript_92727/m.276553 type:complete len:151 (+) Transcript_92727:312-764(+)
MPATTSCSPWSFCSRTMEIFRSSSCVPCSATRPWRMTTILSASLMVVRRCAITRAEPLRASLSRAFCTIFSFLLSSALVASSRRITSGLRIITRAMETRCVCPPLREMPPLPSRVRIWSGLPLMPFSPSHREASLSALITSSSGTSRFKP